MKIEKVSIDTICDCCLIKKSGTIKITLNDYGDEVTLCPSCMNKLIEKIRSLYK